MKRLFETAECEAVRNSIFWELRYEKHENQMKGCGLWCETESEWLADERVDLVGLWYYTVVDSALYWCMLSGVLLSVTVCGSMWTVWRLIVRTSRTATCVSYVSRVWWTNTAPFRYKPGSAMTCVCIYFASNYSLVGWTNPENNCAIR